MLFLEKSNSFVLWDYSLYFVIALESTLYFALMFVSLYRIFKKLGEIPTLMLNKRLMMLHVILFSGTAITVFGNIFFAENFLDLDDDTALLNQWVFYFFKTTFIGCMYTLLLYMVHKIVSPIKMSTVFLDHDEEQRESIVLRKMPNLKIPMFLL
jgi:hypothetical protein